MLEVKHKGLFIALEGGEGAGKTTQREFIAEYFRNQGRQVVVTREPGGTPYAEKIRHLLLSPSEAGDEYVHAETELMLFFAARKQHLEHVIVPNVLNGAVVISDRFVGSTYALQLAHGKLKREDIDACRKIIVGNNLPDATFLFDIDPEVGLARRTASGEISRIDAKSLEYHIRVNNNYRDLLATEKNWIKIDAGQSAEQVQAQLLPHLMDLFNSTLHRPTFSMSKNDVS